VTRGAGGAAGPPLVAPVGGFAALVVALVLEDALPARLVALQRQVEAGRLQPGRLVELRQTWAAIRTAGAEYRRWSEAFVDGRAEDRSAKEQPDSGREIDTATAAGLLGVTPTRVGQLVRAGALPGRQVGGRWLIPIADVELRKAASRA
jgi:excisionase family DNA binding protein